MRDVLPGFAYYKSEKFGIIQRENPYYHPDQRLDISQVYAKDKQSIWANNFTPMVKDWKEVKGDKLKILDVGCNMGILVEGATNEGFDIEGIDINKHNNTNTTYSLFRQYYNKQPNYHSLIIIPIIVVIAAPILWMLVIEDNNNGTTISPTSISSSSSRQQLLMTTTTMTEEL